MSSAVREALRILAAGCLLAILYTGFSGKGIFHPDAFIPPRASASGEENAPEFIEYADARALFDAGEALFIDSRHDFDFELGHIPRAVNIPLKEFEEKQADVASTDKSRTIVVYCDGQECNSSLDLAMKLSAAGFTAVKVFFGGWTEWQKFDGPVAKELTQ
jgi:rhodanese-related sulfurtransferase